MRYLLSVTSGTIGWQVNDYSHRNLLAIPVGIEQKNNVDDLVQRVMHIFSEIFKMS